MSRAGPRNRDLALAMSKVVPVEAGETADEKPPPLGGGVFITSDALWSLAEGRAGGFLLVFLGVRAALLFCAVFSVMGYGHSCMTSSCASARAPRAGRSSGDGAAAFMLICLLMYIFDASYWKGAASCCARIFVVAGVLFGVACVLATSAIPYMPMMFGLMAALSPGAPASSRALTPTPLLPQCMPLVSSSCARRCQGDVDRVPKP